MKRHRAGFGRAGFPSLSVAGALLLALLVVACSKGDDLSRIDSVALSQSGGVRTDSGAVPMLVSDYALTRKRADDWRGAQRALSTVPDDSTFLPVRADGDVAATEVDRTVAYLEGREDSRRAIEESGLSVRDFVLTALALERAERARSSPTGFSGSPVRPENLALVTDYQADLENARRSSGLHIVDYDDDRDRFDGDRKKGGKRGHAHKGKGKGKGKGRG